MTSVAESSKGNTYFRTMAFILFTLAVGGFSIFDILHRNEIPAPSILLICHASAMVGWYILFIAQTQWIGRGNVKRHMQFGLSSLVLAIAILVFGTALNQVTYLRGTVPMIVAANFGALLGFTVAYGIGYSLRKRPQAHKRAMLLAGIAILAPALGRLIISIGLPEPFTFLLYLVLIISLIVFDVRTRKRPHSVSVVLGLTILFILIGAFSFGATETWARFLINIWGPVT